MSSALTSPPPTERYEGIALLPQGFAQVQMRWANGLIQQINSTAISEADALALARQNGQPIALPGFIDTHVHGAAGRDFMEGAGAAAHIAAAHAHYGTTALLATTLTAPAAELAACFADVAQAMQRGGVGAAILGVHLEGPYINDGKLGAQPPHVRPADATEIAALHAIAPIRVLTIAPEVNGNDLLLDALNAQGIRVQIGHSNASYEQAAAALQRGASGVTHVFNAMSGLHHRTPGVVGAALAHAQAAEIIADTIHVHPGAIRVALRAIPQLFCVTDATAATGMPDGSYKLGEHTVHKCAGAVRLADGTLAGSALTMDQALRNLVQVLGLSLADASACTASRAACYLGLSDRGALQEGNVADMVLLSADLDVQSVLARGQWIPS